MRALRRGTSTLCGRFLTGRPPFGFHLEAPHAAHGFAINLNDAAMGARKARQLLALELVAAEVFGRLKVRTVPQLPFCARGPMLLFP